MTIGLSSCGKQTETIDETSKTPDTHISELQEEQESGDQAMVDEVSGMVVSEAYSLTTLEENTLEIEDFGEMKSITSPLTLTGRAPAAWFVDGTFPVSILTLTEETLITANAASNGEEVDGMQEYSVTLEFDTPEDTPDGKIRFMTGVEGGEDMIDSQIIFAENADMIQEEETPSEEVSEEVSGEETATEETPTEEVPEEIEEETIPEEAVVDEETVE